MIVTTSKRLRLTVGFALVLGTTWLGTTSRAAPLDAVGLFAKHATSVVFTRANVTYQRNDEPVTTMSSGAGVFVGRGLILTSCHQLRPDGREPAWIEVIEAQPDTTAATLQPGPPHRVRRVACDVERDLGLLVDELHAGQPTARFADALPGQPFGSIGPTALGFMWSVHSCEVAGIGALTSSYTELYGAVSAERVTALRAELPTGRFVQSSCRNQAMSGSPAYDGAGNIIGLHLFSRVRKEDLAEVDFFLAGRELEAFVRGSRSVTARGDHR